MKIPLSQPDITQLEIDAVVEVLRGSQLSLGPKMKEFEQRVADYIGVAHGIAVSSGTAGLHLCLRALQIGPGDEVVVPSFTFIAAANAIVYVGATPVFVDVNALTLNMDPACVEAAITERTRALLVVHTFGVPAEMDALLAIARRHGLYVVEDACEALGATYRGRRAGSLSDAAVFGFYPNKQITTGEGGMIVTHRESLAREVRAMRNQGRYPSDDWHQHSVLGFNYRLSEINCALGCAQMMRIDQILGRRAAAAAEYEGLLCTVAGLILPSAVRGLGTASWFVYVVRLAAGCRAGARERILLALEADGIQCGRYFAPIHEQPAYAGYSHGALAVTEAESRRAIALPFFSSLSQVQIALVVERLKVALAREDGE